MNGRRIGSQTLNDLLVRLIGYSGFQATEKLELCFGDCLAAACLLLLDDALIDFRDRFHAPAKCSNEIFHVVLTSFVAFHTASQDV